MEPEFVTLIGAVIGAIAASVSLWFQIADRWDRVHVVNGPLLPSSICSSDMYVVNKSKHPIRLVDYGFVTHDGKLYSLPFYFENDFFPDEGDQFSMVGSLSIEPHKEFSVGIHSGKTFVGAYALLSTKPRPTVTADTSKGFFSAHIACLKARIFNRRYY